MTLYIMAAGKSSRFGFRPKILETFDYNYQIFKKYFNNIVIVTTNDIYNEYFRIKFLNANFLIGDFGKGSGTDVYNLKKIINSDIYIAWSDVFFTENVIKNIINSSKNTMTLSRRINPYVNILFKNDKMIDYCKNCSKEGYQDNSIFYIKELKEPKEEFMDMCKVNDFYVKITNDKTYYFNTEEELKNVRKLLKENQLNR